MEYKIKNQEVEVTVGSLGGELHSIKDRDQVEYLWQGNPESWSGQSPVLFPICGSLRENKGRLPNGKIAQMPRHGIVRKKKFHCTKKSENSLLFQIESDKEMYEQFPFHFRLGILYTLEGKTLEIEYQIENLDIEDMPYFIGGHPGFCCPLFEKECYEDYYLEFESVEECDVPTPITTTGLIDMKHRNPFFERQKKLSVTHEMFAKDAIILDQLKSRAVSLKSNNHKKGIRVEFQDFPYLILWSTAKKAPFIALEPWSGLSTCNDENDNFYEKRNVQVAKKGQQCTLSFKICLF